MDENPKIPEAVHHKPGVLFTLLTIDMCPLLTCKMPRFFSSLARSYVLPYSNVNNGIGQLTLFPHLSRMISVASWRSSLFPVGSPLIFVTMPADIPSIHGPHTARKVGKSNNSAPAYSHESIDTRTHVLNHHNATCWYRMLPIIWSAWTHLLLISITPSISQIFNDIPYF